MLEVPAEVLGRVHICTRMPNETCGNERNVDVDIHIAETLRTAFICTTNVR